MEEITQIQPQNQPANKANNMLKKIIILVVSLILLFMIAVFAVRSSYNKSFLKGQELYKQGQYEQSLKEFERVSSTPIGQDPQFLRAIIASYIKLKQFNQAKSYLDKLISIAPNDPQNYKMKAAVYVAIDLSESDQASKYVAENQAKESMEKAYQLDPGGFSQEDLNLLQALRNI